MLLVEVPSDSKSSDDYRSYYFVYKIKQNPRETIVSKKFRCAYRTLKKFISVILYATYNEDYSWTDLNTMIDYLQETRDQTNRYRAEFYYKKYRELEKKNDHKYKDIIFLLYCFQTYYGYASLFEKMLRDKKQADKFLIIVTSSFRSLPPTNSVLFHKAMEDVADDFRSDMILIEDYIQTNDDADMKAKLEQMKDFMSIYDDICLPETTNDKVKEMMDDYYKKYQLV